MILVGYNAARAFGGTGVNGAIIAALFLLGYNPAATTGYYAGFHDFFGLPIDPRGNIIGVLIAAWACARIEGMVRRFMPDDLDMLLTSLITLLITATLAYLIIMPLGGWLFEGMSWLFMHLNSNPFGCAVLAGLFLIAVVFGVHQGFIPVYLALMDSQDSTAYFPSFQCRRGLWARRWHSTGGRNRTVHYAVRYAGRLFPVCWALVNR